MRASRVNPSYFAAEAAEENPSTDLAMLWSPPFGASSRNPK
jgi:hypothetical protein